MGKKRFSVLLILVLALGVMAGCSKKSDAAAAAPEAATEKTVDLSFSSVSVTGDSHTEAMYVFADKVKELSNGTINVKVYDNGSLFSAENEFDALLSGEVDMAYISFPQIATQIPSFSMFGSGYFFSSYDHMTKTLNGDIAKQNIWPQVTAKMHVIPLGSLYLGSREVNTRKKAINSYEDMKGLLLRMPNSEAWLFLGKALGANPTPLSFSELYTALQTGAVDGQDNPLPTIEKAKFYEVTKYIAITNHVIDSIMPCVNEAKWNSLSEAQQKAVREAMTFAIAFNDKARIDSENSLIAFFEKEGLTVTHPDINEFRTNVQKAYEANTAMTSTWDMDLYKKVQALAE